MRPLKKVETILVLIEPAEEYSGELRRCFPESRVIFSGRDRVTEEEIRDADVILGNPPAEFLKDAGKLKLLQLQSAGADAYTPRGILPEGALLTCATGAYGPAVSEHMMASLLSVYKNLHVYRDNQTARRWRCEGAVRSLRGEKVLVLGLGDIGREFARLASAFGASVSGVKRNLSCKPDWVEAVYPLDKLPEILPQFDVVASVLPSSPETQGLFDRAMLKKMKPGSILVNAGRGSLIDSDALYDALQKGPLLAACLDVTDPEPLPPDHPLWDCRNLLLTPHTAGGFLMKETYHRVWKIALENLSAYAEGRELKNRIRLE